MKYRCSSNCSSDGETEPSTSVCVTQEQPGRNLFFHLYLFSAVLYSNTLDSFWKYTLGRDNCAFVGSLWMHSWRRNEEGNFSFSLYHKSLCESGSGHMHDSCWMVTRQSIFCVFKEFLRYILAHLLGLALYVWKLESGNYSFTGSIISQISQDVFDHFRALYSVSFLSAEVVISHIFDIASSWGLMQARLQLTRSSTDLFKLCPLLTCDTNVHSRWCCISLQQYTHSSQGQIYS